MLLWMMSCRSCGSAEKKGATLELPIESYKLDGETYLVARFSGLVSDQETENAIRQFY